MKASQESVEALMYVSLEMTEARLEKTNANGRKVETQMEACLEEMEVKIIGAQKDRLGPATGRDLPEPPEKTDQGRFCTRNS
jgi:hypothetical protein